MSGHDFSTRPVSSAPGHWVLARAGKRVLRPGGLKLTRALVERSNVTGHDVVELAPGLGRTARELLAAKPTSYTGVDRDPAAVARVNQIVVSTSGTCREGDAAETGLPDECADVVLGEAMLTMQSPRAKDEIVSEAVRLLRPGGRYAIHELALVPDDIDESAGVSISRALARAINVNARPLTVAAWADLLTRHGLNMTWHATAPMALLKVRRNLADEGPAGAARIAWNLATQPGLRRRIVTMRRTFAQHEKSLCGVAIVATKPE